MFKNKAFIHFIMGLSAIVFFGSSIGMSMRLEPFYSVYYSLAWWSFIFFGQSCLRLTGGEDTLYSNTRTFLLWIPLSIVLWLIFETLNFRLNCWQYLNFPAQTWVRWLQYLARYAAVLPALFTMTALLDKMGLFPRMQSIKPLPNPEKSVSLFVALGALGLLLPLLWPKYFFPLIWVAFIFLLEPLNYFQGETSLLRRWREGSLRLFSLLLLAGLICGFLWELWNFWAGSKWFYTLPLPTRVKLFELPVPGYLGFPFLALELFIMYQTTCIFGRCLNQRKSMALRILLWIITVTILTCLALLVLKGIDAYTLMGPIPG